tara:strand:+ start:1571 stop:2611 length:1041 start_codon:yes stop_codon:yes gene_type:complete
MTLKIHKSMLWKVAQTGYTMEKDLKASGYCSVPYEYLIVDMHGDCFACMCQDWLPISIGNVFENDLEDIWHGAIANELRESVTDGTMKYCNNFNCSKIIQAQYDIEVPKKYPRPRFINFCYDMSCNLHCPSCRTDKIFISEGPQYEKMLQINDKISKFIQGSNVTLNITGSGDPFGSKVFREFLYAFDGNANPNVRFHLQTNGQMIKKCWKQMEKIHKNIDVIRISMDAGTEETYKIVRAPGDWNRLIANIAYLNSVRYDYNFQVWSDFVVQKINYKEIPKYIRLAENLGIDRINLQKITDWGTWGTKEKFDDVAVWKETHEEYLAYTEIVKNIRNERVQKGNLEA